VRRIDEDAGEENGRQRKAYVLTQLGKGILEAETIRMQDLVTTAQSRSIAGGEI
jgi:hypothetical protein